MANTFKAKLVFKGANGKEVPRYIDLGTFDLGTPGANFDGANSALAQIRGAYQDVTAALIVQSTLTEVEEFSGTPGGDVFQTAMVNVYLDADGEKVSQLYWPAPLDAIMLSDTGPNRDVVDTADTEVIQLVQQFSQHAFISDGEQVNVTVNNGIKDGYRDIRDMNLKQ